jgi:hypothetical protein
MTLILTELTAHGIAMAADSMVTSTHVVTGLSHTTPNAAVKLQAVQHLSAGISCWGMGEINRVPTDEWLANFIIHNTGFTTLQSFAGALANELNTVVEPSPAVESRMGFHLAGFEDYQGVPTPSFFHIHDGPSTTLQERGISVKPQQFNANHDVPPEVFRQLAAKGQGRITRNGDYVLYVQLSRLLESFFQGLRPIGVVIPNSQNLADRCEYLVFQIRTVSTIYRLSNLVPGIGGPINYLGISPAGIHSQGVVYT